MSFDKNIITTDQPAKAGAHRLLPEVIIGGIEIVLPDSNDELLNLAVNEVNRSGIHAARAGYILLELKERLNHGEYEKAVEKAGIGLDQAQEFAKIARALMSLTAAQQAKFTTFSKTKLLTLARLSQETLEELAEGDSDTSLDDIAQMSTRQLQDFARDLKVRLETEQLKNQIADSVTLDAKPDPWPAPVMTVREESTLSATSAHIALDTLESLMSQMTLPDMMLKNSDSGRAEFSAMATTLHLNLISVYARAGQLLSAFNEYGWEEFASTKPDHDPLLTADEALKIMSKRTLMLQEDEAKKQMRENAKAMNASQRGRPKGSKKK